MHPKRPRHTPEHAELCLEALVSEGLGDRISLGALLEAPAPAPWPSVLLDSLADLLANKMTALVERGAPRDFRDVYSVCEAGLATPADCWRLWRERQRRAEASTDGRRARLAVETHLARIVQHRRLDQISDPVERGIAERARKWYETELLDALMD